MADSTKEDVWRERAARELMKADGFTYNGAWLIDNIDNPRIAAWVKAADAVLSSRRSRERLPDRVGRAV